jgi:hypothetical protein
VRRSSLPRSGTFRQPIYSSSYSSSKSKCCLSLSASARSSGRTVSFLSR